MPSPVAAPRSRTCDPLTRIIITPTAQTDLERLIRSHRLTTSTAPRIQRSLAPLESFPEMGARLVGPWARFRFVIGPWRWMVLVYDHDPVEDIVWIVTIVDGRSAASPTSDGEG